VFGGGGGVIVAEEIRELQDYGVARIYSPEDGQKMGLQGMINDMLARCDEDLSQHCAARSESTEERRPPRGYYESATALWRGLITALENGTADPQLHERMLKEADALSVRRSA